MDHHLIQIVALIALLGVTAQWVAWRLKLPAIIFLALFGVIAGPVLGLVRPATDLAGLLHPMVKLGVAIILFEGGLNLHAYELKQAASGIRRLVTVGVLASFTLGSLAAHYIGGLSWPVATIFGAILVVTGPTVIMPLLRHARLRNRPASLLKWEGIINDPTGAILAVVIFEYVVHTRDGGFVGVVTGLGAGLSVAAGLGAACGWLLGTVYKRGYVPEYLKGAGAMAVALAVYAAANEVLDESGLLAVTILGLVMGNMRLPGIEELRRFKEHLTIVIVSAVFIVLTADLDPAILAELDWRSAALIVVVLAVVRPVSIFLSTLGAEMSWQEKTLLAWIAPRGVVAAAMAGVFGHQLATQGFAHAEQLLPLVFSVIFITVILHGVSIGWLARRLDLSATGSHGVLLIGASPWLTNLAGVLQELKVPVMIADRSWQSLREPRLAGIPVYFGQVLSESVDERLEFNEADCVFAATGSDSYNSLVCSNYAGEFGRTRVFQLPSADMDQHESRQLSHTIRGLIVPDEKSSYNALIARWYSGWRFQKTGITEEFSFENAVQAISADSILFAQIGPKGQVDFVSQGREKMPGPGSTLIWFGPPVEKKPAPETVV